MRDEHHPSPDLEPLTAPGPPGQPAPQRLLRRSRQDRVLGGVSGGLGHYFGIDPILIRLAWVALVLAAGTGVLLYIICWVVIPEEPEDGQFVARAATAPQSTAALRYLIGGALIVIGGLLLLRMLLPSIDAQLIWAAALIGIGLIIVLQGIRR